MKNKIDLSKKYLKTILPLLKQIEKCFGYESTGLYFALYEKLQDFAMVYPISKLNKLSRCLKIQKKKLTLFLELASSFKDKNNFSVLSLNDKYFWINDLSCIKNKKHIGRKKVSIEQSKKFDDFPFVNITVNQYQLLINKYGKIFIEKAFYILNSWFEQGSREALTKINKNNYWYFRKDSWLIYQTKKTLGLL